MQVRLLQQVGDGIDNHGIVFLGTGTRQDVFHSTGIFSWLRLRLKRYHRIADSCLAQVLRTLWLIWSGIAALPFWSLSSCLLTRPVVTVRWGKVLTVSGGKALQRLGVGVQGAHQGELEGPEALVGVEECGILSVWSRQLRAVN